MANALRSSLSPRPQRPATGWRARAPYYAAIAMLAILVLAYIDGGEEPIRPISQAVSIPGTSAESE